MTINKNKIIIILIMLTCICFAEEKGNLAGLVVEEESGMPLPNANIIIMARWIDGKEMMFKNSLGTITDEEGSYFISNLQPGLYSVKVSYMGFADNIKEKVEIKPNQTTTTNFKLIFQAIKGQQVTIVRNRSSRIAEYSYIAAKLPLSLHKTPMSIDVITDQVLKEQQAVVLSDALQNTVGINIQNNLGTQDYFIIRGFDSNSAGLVLNSGIKLPFTSPFKFYGIGYNDLYNVEQVEVLKGPAAFLYGGNTLSGAVNLVKKQPRFNKFGSLKINHSRFDSYQESFDINQYNDNSNIAYRVNGIYKVNRESRKHNKNETLALNPSFAWKPKEYSQLTIDIDFKHEKLIPDVGIPLFSPGENWELPNVSKKTDYQEDFDKSVFDKYQIRIDYQTEMPNNAKLENRLFSTFIEGYSRFTFPLLPYKVLNGPWVVNRNLYTIDQKQFVVGNQLEYSRPIYLGKYKNNILVGAEVIYSSNITDKRTSEISAINLVNQRVIKGDDFDELVTFPKVNTETDMVTCAVYLVDYLTLTPKVQLFGGLRGDYIIYDTNRQNDPFNYIGRNLSSDPTPFSKNFLKASPMIGIIWQESDDLTLYVNSGRAFASGERIIDEPENSTQYEIGYHYRSKNRRFRNSVALFSIRKQNVSIPISGPLQGNEYSSKGIVQSSGFEGELVYDFNANWYVSYKTSFTFAEYVKYNALTSDDGGKAILKDFSGNVPVFVPSNISTISLNKDFQNGLNFGIGIRNISDQYADIDNSFRIKSHAIYQSHIGYSFNKWTFQLNVNKMSRKDMLSRGLGFYSVVPVIPLEIKGSIEAVF